MKPVAVLIDTDPESQTKAQAGLARAVGSDARVEVVSSVAAAEALLTELKDRDEQIAVVVVNHSADQSVAQQLLDRVHIGFPDAGTVVICTEKDGCAQHAHGADEHLIIGSWSEVGERLSSAVRAAMRKEKGRAREEVTVVGDQWSPRSHEIKDQLCRHRVPYRWVDASDERSGVEVEPARLPIIQFPDGSKLEAPTDQDLAEKLGFSTEAELEFYDLVIIGGGPAGLAAAVYGASEGLRVVVVEREAPGGQAAASSLIENYLGFPEGLSGAELSERAVAQARRFGAEILLTREAKSLQSDGGYRVVTLDDDTVLTAHAVLVSTGVSYKRLKADGAERLQGRGVYYGATLAEAARYQGEDVALLGGGNSAGQAAMLLARYAGHVRMIMAEDKIATMSQYLVNRIGATPNIEIVPSTIVETLQGDDNLEAITVKNTETGEQSTFPTKGLFIWIGVTPHTRWLAGAVAIDEDGFVLAGRDLTEKSGLEGWDLERWPFMLETSMPGVFVAGDVRHGSVKRIGSAVGEGAMAIQMVHQYLRDR
jgi:thioredoxin reductase (NADPH)